MTATRDALRPLKSLVKRHVSPASIDRLLLAVPRLYPLLRYESQLSPAQLAILRGLLARGPEGNVIECGVYRAGTTVLLARMLAELHLDKRIYALDSFGGFAGDIEDEIRRGLVVADGRAAFRANSPDYVRRKLAVLGVADRIQVVPGFFENTLPAIDDRFCLALIDCDLEQSITFCLEHLWDRIADGGHIVVDDYTNPGYPGAALAADRFFARVPCKSRRAGENFLVVEKGPGGDADRHMTPTPLHGR
jgi:predicted O-methyltransferase YrrM